MFILFEKIGGIFNKNEVLDAIKKSVGKKIDDLETLYEPENSGEILYRFSGLLNEKLSVFVKVMSDRVLVACIINDGLEHLIRKALSSYVEIRTAKYWNSVCLIYCNSKDTGNISDRPHLQLAVESKGITYVINNLPNSWPGVNELLLPKGFSIVFDYLGNKESMGDGILSHFDLGPSANLEAFIHGSDTCKARGGHIVNKEGETNCFECRQAQLPGGSYYVYGSSEVFTYPRLQRIN